MIAPAGCVEQRSLNAGLGAIRAAGFEVALGANVLAHNGYLAGRAEDRAKDLLDFFHNPEIEAIFCARGGFGSAQVLPHLTENLGSYPKICLGYSDVTMLLNWLRQQCGMVTFHAPMVAMDLARGLSEASKAHFWPLLTGELGTWKLGLGEVIRGG